MKETHRAGFARRELNEARVLPQEAFLAPLEVRCFVVETDSGLACWLVYDVTCMYVEQASQVRAAVAAALGCGPDAVVVHCTHTHSVPDYFVVFPVEVLAAQAVAAALEARARWLPFRLVDATVDVGSRFSILRRKLVPGMGTFTVWYGYRLENGRPDGAPLIREQAERIFGPGVASVPGLSRPIWFEDPVDPLVQGLVFVGADGKVLGSLVRFSAHPHTTSHVHGLKYHPDFPGFTREVVERELGGMCIYLTGPCGDIVPKEEMQFRMPPAGQRPAGAESDFGPSSWHKEATPGEALRAAQRIGEGLASALLSRLKGGSPLGRPEGHAPREAHSWPAEPKPPSIVRSRSASLIVPIREDFAGTTAAAASGRAAETERLLRLQKAGGEDRRTLWEMRSLADRIQQLGLEEADIRSFPAGALEARRLTLEMGLLQIGDIILAGLPSEPCVGTTFRLRANTIGERLWTVSLANGWVGYLAGPADCATGGYESNRTPLPPDGLAQYEAQACDAIRGIVG